jgi:glutamate-ammonia-ligase adenylyltransferase
VQPESDQRIPAPLRAAASDGPDPERVLHRLVDLADAGADLSAPGLEAALPAVLANSDVLARWLLRHPEAVGEVADPRPVDANRLEAWWAAAGGPTAEDEAAVQTALRAVKYRAFVRLTARDVGAHAPVQEICREITSVAAFTCDKALRWARADLEARHGPALGPDGAPLQFVVMGMGKLGGGELNYSSDVDLIYFYDRDEGSCGDLDPHSFFTRLGEQLGRLLGTVTEDGFVFRVDLGLRPEGRSGTLCNSLAAAERYYESWGRTWERMAWLRAQPLAGDLELGRTLLQTLRPWIYQRTVGPGLLDELRALKTAIDRRPRGLAASRGTDLKLDPGGIRAVEFFANTLQLLHGGRDPTLRDASTIGAMDRLYAAGHVADAEHDALLEAYLLYRRIEHRLQMMEERQTHVLPKGAQRDAIALRLGFEGPEPGAALTATLEGHRARVAQIYSDLLGAGADDVQSSEEERAARALLATGDDAARAAIFADLDFTDPEQAAHLLRIAGRRPSSPLSSRASAGRRERGVALLVDLLRSADPERALTHLAGFLTGSGARDALLRSLGEHPRATRLLIGVFANSDFVSERLLRDPGLLDALFDRGLPDEDGLRAQLHRAADSGPDPDDEQASLERLARAREELTLRIGIADIGGELDAEAIEGALTAVAETVLGEVVRRASVGLERRFGWPLGPDSERLNWCVVGMGKLGGREMSYGSDLDLVFVFDGHGRSDGRKAIDAREWFTRLAQRSLSLLALPTRAGALYAVDTRLRPQGGHGTLVTTLERFERHHLESAAEWERMALVRARPVAASDEAFERAVAETIERLVYERPVPEALNGEMRRIRSRVEAELAREDTRRYNPKVGRGGLMDVEFVAQALQIRHGRHARSLRTPSTGAALRAASELGILDEMDAVVSAHGFLRRLERTLRIVRGRSEPELRTDARNLRRVARRMGYRRDPLDPETSDPGERLLLDYEEATGLVRRVFETVFATDDARRD